MIVLKVILFTLFITGSHCRCPDKVYCVNERCDEPISKAKTLLSYTSVDPDLITYRSNSEAIVYMKSAGTNPELWYVKINGKAGFANSKFLRENKLIEKNPLIVVPYEPKAQENVQPNRVKQAHEVVEGTTIYTTEATGNNAQQETATESPTTASNEEHTPSLDGAKEILNENSQNNVPNISSQTNNEVNENQFVENQNSEPTPADKLLESYTTIKNIPKQSDNPIETDLNEGKLGIESSTQTIPNSAEEVLIMDDATQKEPTSEEQLNLEVPNKLSAESSGQSLLSSVSGTLNSKKVLHVPDNKEFNSLTESEQTDSMEQNTSLANSNVENVPLTQETTTEPNNVVNGDTSSSSDAVTNQSQEENSPLKSKDAVTETAASENIGQTVENTVSQVEPLVDQKETILPGITPFINEEITTVPPVEIPPAMETIPTIPPTLETTTLPSLDTIPVLETLPPLSPTMENVHSTLPESNPIPNLPPEVPAIESQFSSTTETPKTLPDLTDTIPVTTETIPPIYPQAPQSVTEEGSFFDTFTTPTPDYNLENADNLQSTTESLEENTAPPSSEQLEDMPSTTETPVEDMQGFISNMFSTVADIWPSTTETPPSIYNAEEYPSYESEKIDKTEEVNTGFSFMKYILSTYYSVMGTGEEAKALFNSVAETCYSDDYCDGTSNDSQNRLLTFLLTTASSVLLFTLGYYYIDNRRQDGRLIGQINSLQRDLLFTSKECEILKEELTSTKNKLAGIEDSSFGMDDMVQSLREEINELKATNDRLRNSLDDNEKLLRVSENTAGELQNTLGEVENTLSELLAERANSEEQIVELNGKIQAFEEELISVSRDRDNFQLKYVSAESALEEFKKLKKQFEDVSQQLTEAKNTIELQKYEIDALKDAIKELKSGTPSNVDVTSLIDHTEIKAKLAKAIQEKKVLETKYEAERKEKARLSDELQTTQETLHTTSQNASEALTRLDVLGKYFQEREGELMKELTAKESLWLSKQGESASTVEKIELLQQEVQRYKEKCDALTLELAEQESSRRTALSNVEARAHAAWLEARAAKRDTDAARDEAAALRRKLASLSAMATADGAVSPHHKVASPLENVENPVIPPPLPPMFLPPPLLPPLPRPPPLGRLPSPHPPRYGRYSPESRYSPDSRYSPETVRYSPDSRYSPRSRRSPYSPRSRRRSRSRERYEETRVTRSRNGPADTETEYNSDSPTREPRRRGRYSRHSGPSSGSGCSSESDK